MYSHGRDADKVLAGYGQAVLWHMVRLDLRARKTSRHVTLIYEICFNGRIEMSLVN